MSKSLTVAFSTREIKQDYIEHIRKTSGNPNIEILVYENKGTYSLAELYNKAIDEAENNIVLLCHDDLIFDTNNWASKLIKHFDYNHYGVIGLAGTDNLVDGCWWTNRKDMYGIVNHVQNGKKHTSKYSEGFGDNLKQVVTVDGLFIAVHKGRILCDFDEDFKGFHFYDIPFCLTNHLAGVRVGLCTNIRVTHLSIGEVNKEWYKNKEQFELKYKDQLPCRVQ